MGTATDVNEPYELNDREFAAVSALEGRKRFEHLLKRICDTERVYVLTDSDDDLVVLAADEDASAAPQLPIWPHPRYVEAYGSSRGGGAGRAEIELTSFVEEMLPGLAEDQVEIVVMPTHVQSTVLALGADELRKAVLSYHDDWYGGWPKHERLE